MVRQALEEIVAVADGALYNNASTSANHTLFHVFTPKGGGYPKAHWQGPSSQWVRLSFQG
jgi:deoxyxylulose-5-phosphate synthase